jgi:hypothetical protein
MSQARSAVEDMQDVFRRTSADGVITAEELAELAPAVTLSVVLVGEAGDCQVAAMAVLKGGVGAYRASQLLSELDEHYGYDRT